MTKSNRAILVAESDEHGGNALGLLNPDTVLLSKDKKKFKPQLTETQQQLWEIREWGRKEAIKLADKSPIVLLKVGDMNQGMVYDVKDNLASQIKIAFMNTKPWLSIKNLVAIRVDSGTEVHSFGGADAEEILVENIHNSKPDLDVQLVDHGLSEIYGVWVDHAHHGCYPGSREWLKGNVALYYLRDIMMKDILRGRVPPQLILRGHYHAVVEVFNRICGQDGKVYRSWLWVLPSLCGMNGHALKVTKSEYEITNGIVAFEIVDGKMREAFEFTRTTDIRIRETII